MAIWKKKKKRKYLLHRPKKAMRNTHAQAEHYFIEGRLRNIIHFFLILNFHFERISNINPFVNNKSPMDTNRLSRHHAFITLSYYGNNNTHSCHWHTTAQHSTFHFPFLLAAIIIMIVRRRIYLFHFRVCTKNNQFRSKIATFFFFRFFFSSCFFFAISFGYSVCY